MIKIHIMINGRRQIMLMMLCIAFALMLRLPSFKKSVIDWDESTYLLVADNLLQGGLPYKDMWDNKGVALYLIFALIIIITGRSIPGLRLFTGVWVGISAYFVYLAGKELVDEKTGIFAALFFIIATSLGPLGGLASNAEIFFMLPTLAGIYLIAGGKPSLMKTLVAGSFFGLAFNIKSISIFDFVAVLISLPILQSNVNNCGPSVSKSIILFAFGFTLPFIAAMIYYVHQEYLAGFLSTYFLNSAQFIKYAPDFHVVMKDMLRSLNLFFSQLWAIHFLSLAAIFGLFTGIHKKKNAIAFMMIWFLLVFAGIFVHRRFWNHMFLQTVPVLSLLSGTSISTFLRSGKSLIKLILVAMLLGFWAITSIEYNIQQSFRMLTGQSSFVPEDIPMQVSMYLKKRLKAGEYIYVPNKMHIVYYLTEARVPTRYANPVIFKKHNMYDKILGIDTFEEVKEILNTAPAYIVFSKTSVLISPKVDRYFREYIRANYVLEIVKGTTYIYRHKDRKYSMLTVENMISNIQDTRLN